MTFKEFNKRSVELKVYRGQRNLFIFIYIVFVFFSFIISFGSNDGVMFWPILALISLSFIPFIIYFIYRIRYITSNYKNYVFLDVEFKEMHAGFMRGTTYFTLNFIYNNREYKIDTKSIFSSSLIDIINPNFDEYLNENVLIALNPNSNEVVVIERI